MVSETGNIEGMNYDFGMFVGEGLDPGAFKNVKI